MCSEPRKRPDGRRKYFACNDLRVTARQIIMGYRLRWAIELFHKDVKQRLGCEDVATSGFDAVMSHVHWVYCAYIVLHLSPPGVWVFGSIGTENRFKECSPYHSGRVRANKTVNCGHMHPEHLGDLFGRLAFTQ